MKLKLAILIAALAASLTTARATDIALAAFSVNRQAVPVVTELFINGFKEVKTDQAGLFAFPFTNDEADEFYLVSISNLDPEHEIKWRVVSQAFNGFVLYITVDGNPYDPPTLCVVTATR